MEGTMAITSAQATALLKEICDTIVEAVRAAGPLGCPSGNLYAVLMTAGCTMEQYNQMMAGLVRAGMLRKSGNLYFVAEGK
jgi:hypothetical protein